MNIILVIIIFFSRSAILQKHLEYHVYWVKNNMLSVQTSCNMCLTQQVPLLPKLHAEEEEKGVTSEASNTAATKLSLAIG